MNNGNSYYGSNRGYSHAPQPPDSRLPPPAGSAYNSGGYGGGYGGHAPPPAPPPVPPPGASSSYGGYSMPSGGNDYGPVYGGAPQYHPMMSGGSSLPPMPHPTDPTYPGWYKKWYDMYGHSLLGSNQQNYPPPAPPPGPPPPKAPRLSLSNPPPPPPPSEPVPPPPADAPGSSATPLAAKKGAVIYTTPRPPTPEHLKRKVPSKEMSFPLEPAAPPPPDDAYPFLPPEDKMQKMEREMKEEAEKKKKEVPKMDWYYDGQSWVYADKQPEKKPPSEEQIKTAEKIYYTYAKDENPVKNALINSLRGKYKDPNKPKIVLQPTGTERSDNPGLQGDLAVIRKLALLSRATPSHGETLNQSTPASQPSDRLYLDVVMFVT